MRSKVAVRLLDKVTHSTETAIVKIVADFLRLADRVDVTFLSLLDLSAAFDTVNHDILITRMHDSFGLRDIALSCISSFITGVDARRGSVSAANMYGSSLDGTFSQHNSSLSRKPPLH